MQQTRSSKPIEEVKVGDQVLAAAPAQDKSEAKAVVRTIVGNGEKNLVEVTVDVDGAAGSAVEPITATGGHPFWLPDEQRWAKASELSAGKVLLNSNGVRQKVSGVRAWTEHARVFNLTVEGIHTYFVLAGISAVLVHNCGVEDAAKAAAASAPKDSTMSAAAGFRGHDDLIETGYSGHSSAPSFYEAAISDALPAGGQVAGRTADNCAEIRACNNLIAVHAASSSRGRTANRSCRISYFPRFATRRAKEKGHVFRV